MKKIKVLFLVVAGNILEYYDFLLFAHIGHFIIPQFIPEAYAKESYLFALVLFALPFVIRPIGGYFFGKMADSISTHKALSHTLFYASIASIMIAIIPTYNHMGVLATIIFIILRSLQGFALGGEYTTAGTLLMDEFPKNKSFISGILGASGTIGSLMAFSFASLYCQFFKDTDIWRLFFLFGGIATYYSSYLRKHHLSVSQKFSEVNHLKVEKIAIYRTLALGAVTSVSCFIPMVYSHFYMTQILKMPIGLRATLISLVVYILITPLVGYVSDRIKFDKYVSVSFVISLPLAIGGFYFLQKGLLIGQVFLTLTACIVGANIHVLMNQMFPLKSRSRHINFYFTLGASLGGLVPSLSGYLGIHYGFYYTPVLFICLLLVVNACLFINFHKHTLLKR